MERREEIQALKNIERIADALEKGVTEPEELQANPPMCPHCGEFNPVIYVLPEPEGQGQLAEIVIHGKCLSCGEHLFAVVESYSMHATIESVQDEMQARREAGML